MDQRLFRKINVHRRIEQPITNEIDSKFIKRATREDSHMTGQEITTTKKIFTRATATMVRGPTRGARTPHQSNDKKNKMRERGECEVKISCTNSKSLQHVQRAYAVYQLVQYCCNRNAITGTSQHWPSMPNRYSIRLSIQLSSLVY